MVKTDETIKKDTVEQLYWDDRVNASDVKVDVNDCVVTLSGKVPNYNAMRSALESTYALREVDSVINNLAVEYADAKSLPTDYSLQTNIEGILLLSSSIDSSNLSVSVQSGIATIDGSVDAYWKKQKVDELVMDVTGIIGVVNRISVVPSKDFLDKAIAEDIVQALDRNALINVNEIDVIVEDGVVTLSGTVQDWPALQAALNTAKYTSGVVDVMDVLAIGE